MPVTLQTPSNISRMPGILEMLEGVCKEKGIKYEEWLEGLKKNGQWHVEVY